MFWGHPCLFYFQEKGRELITKVFHQQNIKFRCKFSIFLTKNNDVSLRLSSVACWPRRRRGISVENLELRGKKGLYVTSFTINPTRLRLLAKKTSFGNYVVFLMLRLHLLIPSLPWLYCRSTNKSTYPESCNLCRQPPAVSFPSDPV